MLGRTTALSAVTALVIAGATVPTFAADAEQSTTPPGTEIAPDQLPSGDEEALVRLQLPDQAALDQLVAEGADIATLPAASPERRGGDPMVDLVVSGDELAQLQAEGATVLQVIQDEDDGMQRFAASQEAADRRQSTGMTQRAEGSQAQEDTLVFVSAAWWTSNGQTFVQGQVATTAVNDPDAEITLTWETADGDSDSVELFRYADAGEYLYHFSQPVPVPDQPVSLTATSSLGGTKRATPTAWPGSAPPQIPDGYQSDFIDEYMTPHQVSERMDRLARQYPDLVDLVDLPEQTNGYRRHARGFLGDPDTAAVVVESAAYGNDGGNDLRVATLDPGAADQPLSASVQDGILTISLATGPDGALTSTTDDVAAIIEQEFAAEVTAFVEDGSAGAVMPVAQTQLDDGLDASHLNGEGWTVQALRIGRHRDGSRPGVLAYSQEHAREWATPLVTMEFAERMLANAVTDPETATLLDDVEIFVLPVVNPDGANYSFYDYNFQRKSMTNYCTDGERDPRLEDRWGVDLNRNHAVGSVFDGYEGGSLDCLSGGFAGPAELSEPESSNLIALVEDNPTITHAINVHSYGGYFMWSPGAYSMPGRIPLPEPGPAEALSFEEAAQRIVAAISGHRDTVTWRSKTGPVIDVLYSAGGNSADALYYDYDISAWDFEVGNDLWNPGTQQWEGVGFQPPYAEAHEESQEYAAGLVELVRVASDAAAEEDEVVRRLAGEDRYGTSVAVGREAFPDSDTAVLVSGAEPNLVDGLVAGPLGRTLSAPVLLTERDDVPGVITDELAARGVTEVVVLGGEAAVGPDAVQELTDLGIAVDRVSGTNRYGTAAAAAERVGGTQAVISSGEAGHLSDALAVSGPAARLGRPILLTEDDELPTATLDALSDITSTLVVGGMVSVQDEVLAQLPDPTRVSGTDRWATAVAVADHVVTKEGLDPQRVAIGAGSHEHMVDALPGGALGLVTLLTPSEELADATTRWLTDSTGTRRAVVLGGTAAVSAQVAEQVASLLSAR